MKKFVVFVMVLVLVFTVSCSKKESEQETQDEKAKAEKTEVTKSKGAIEHATMTGTLVCLGCDLSKTEGARAAFSVYGHKHALKMEDGKYINLLENQYSADLIKGEKFHNKPIEIEGTYFASANQIDVHAFTVEGEKKGWCDHCKAMDGCPFKKSGGM